MKTEFKQVKMRYFKYSEFVKSETARKLGIDNNFPNDEVKMNIKRLVINVLDVTRYFLGKPIYITSGYRCPLLNKAVHGAKNSQHMQGKAADFTTGSRRDNKICFEWIKEWCENEFDQLIEYNDYSFIHVSFDYEKFLKGTQRHQVLHMKK